MSSGGPVGPPLCFGRYGTTARAGGQQRELRPVRIAAQRGGSDRLQLQLATVYGNVDAIDAWVGGLCEDLVAGALVGELNFTVLKAQFEALRDGDRFWYQLVFSGAELQEIEDTTLADVIRRNTQIAGEIQDNVFLIAP